MTEVQQMKEIVRILNTDMKGSANIYYALTRIKGISWALSNALCPLLGFERSRKVGTLSEEEIKRIEHTIKNLSSQPLPSFILNRPRTEEGTARHLVGSDLELQTKMEIKRMHEIQSYKGIRHALGLPVRGQRTRSHFRHGRAVGVVKKKAKQKVGTKRKGE